MLDFFRALKDRTQALNFATDHIARWTAQHLRAVPAPHRVLDIGLGGGRDLLAVREACKPLQLELYGIESQDRYVRHARENGIQTFGVDIER